MAVNRGLWVPINTGNIGTTEVEARLAMAGMFESNTGVNPRSGLLNPPTTTVVTGKAGAMAYDIAALPGVVINRATGEGAYQFSTTGVTTVGTIAAPVANSRIDVIWIKQNDQSKAGDTNNLAMAGVTNGTAAASPVAPSIPAGAMELARATVTSTTTQTSTVSITQTWRYTALMGCPIITRSAAERAEITAPRVGQRVIALDNLARQLRWTGSRWTRAEDALLGRGALGAVTTVAGTPAWTVLASVTSMTFGSECFINFGATLINANSGDHRTAAVRVMCDGAEVDSFAFFSQWISGQNVPTFPSHIWGHTPSAGTHTWTLEANANQPGAVQAIRATMTVTERA